MPVEAIGFFLSEVSEQKKNLKSKNKKRKKNHCFLFIAGHIQLSMQLFGSIFAGFLAFSAALWPVTPQASWGKVFGSKIGSFLAKIGRFFGQKSRGFGRKSDVFVGRKFVLSADFYLFQGLAILYMGVWLNSA
jgi:hypothetical protein